jgi:phage shock protein PspC (stress-responsive transcriptional regulator)
MNDRLYRSRDDRVIAGVAGGLAEMWDIDPSLLRIVWALLIVFTGGVALVVYIDMAIVVPEEPYGYSGAFGPSPFGASAGPAGWPPAAPVAGTPAADPAAPATTAGTEAPATAPTPSAWLASGSVPPPSGAGWVSPDMSRQEARYARQQARVARRAARGEHRGGLSGGLIGGLVLVGLGLFFLAREWLPQLDFDWFWPLILVGLGVVLLLSAVGRGPREPGSGA